MRLTDRQMRPRMSSIIMGYRPKQQRKWGRGNNQIKYHRRNMNRDATHRKRKDG